MQRGYLHGMPIIASLVAIAVTIGVTVLGTNLITLFSYIGGQVAAP